MIAELGEVLFDERQLFLPAFGIDTEDPLQLGSGQVESAGVEVGGFGQTTNGCVDRVDLVVAALENPLQHAAVLAVAGPEEFPVLIGTEPVHVENLGKLRRGGTLADGEPVGEVVSHVVAAEGQHGHGAAAAVVSLLAVAPRKVPCCQWKASVTRGTMPARRPPNRMASMGTPPGSSHSGAMEGHCEAGVVKREFG